MGGPGSGSFPDNPNHRGGRSKKAAVQVCGSGVPLKPDGLTEEQSEIWQRVYDATSGVAFEQDSFAIAEMAQLLWRQGKHHEALAARPIDIDLNKQSLAIGRALLVLFGQFGLTSRTRQMLLVPKNEQAEVDPLDALRAEYG